MSIKNLKILRSRYFYLWMIIPAVVILVAVSFMIRHGIFPIQKEILLKEKKEKLKDIGMMVINRFEYYDRQVVAGKISLTKAQDQAKSEITIFNNGRNKHNYVWIHNMNSNLKIPKPVGQKFNRILESKRYEFLEYTKISKDQTGYKNQGISLVMGFGPWKWVVGIGLDSEDFSVTLEKENKKLVKILGIILLVILIPTALMAWIVKLRDLSMISEIKLQTNELKRLAMIANHTHSGILIMNKKGEIEWLNKSFTNITGYILQEVLGKKPGDFLIQT